MGECTCGRVVAVVVVWWVVVAVVEWCGKAEGLRGGRGIGGTWWWWEGLVARDRSS